jgi:hypothetical protein
MCTDDSSLGRRNFKWEPYTCFNAVLWIQIWIQIYLVFLQSYYVTYAQNVITYLLDLVLGVGTNLDQKQDPEPD